MEAAVRTDVQDAEPRAPAHQHIYFPLDEGTIGLGRAYAKHRGRSFGAWLSAAIRDRCDIDELDQWVNLHFHRTEEQIREFEEEITEKLGPWAPAPPFHTVSTVLSERTIRRVRDNARRAGMSESDWMAKAAWFSTIVEGNLMAAERHRARVQRRKAAAEARERAGR